MLDPIQRRRLGILFLFLALLFGAVATAAGVGNAIRRQSVASDLAAADQECQNRVGSLGGKNVAISGEMITASWPDVNKGMETISGASVAALACPGWKMTSFCMGEGCTTKGGTITLTRVAER
jgi:hypothetical protein